MYRRLLAVMIAAAVVVVATLTVSSPASAQTIDPPVTAQSIRLTKPILVNGKLSNILPVAPHNFGHAISTVSPMYSGGGCVDTNNIGSCINHAGKTINGDFYHNYFVFNATRAAAYLVNTANTVVYGSYFTSLNVIGHYPALSWASSGSGCMYMVVDVYDQTFDDAHFRYSAYSHAFCYP